MRTFLYFLLLNFFLTGSAQEYQPMISQGNMWYSTHYIANFDWNRIDYYDYRFRLTENVLIYNEKEYLEVDYKIRKRHDDIVIQDWTEWQSGKFYINENIEDKKVYIYYSQDNIFYHEAGEYLLYDFNLEVGDFANFDGFSNSWSSIQISNITYENWFNQIRKVYHFDSVIHDNPLKIIEGVGSTHGLNTLDLGTDSGWELTNFGQNLSTTEINSSKSKVYPNPFTNQIQIDAEKPIQHLELFDVNGKLILSKKSISELNSNLNQLEKGIYILQITYPNQQKENIKLIKK